MDAGGFCAAIVSLRALILNKLHVVALGPRPLRPVHRWTEPTAAATKSGGKWPQPWRKGAEPSACQGCSISDPCSSPPGDPTTDGEPSERC